MSNRLQTFLLAVVAIAVVASPLRGTDLHAEIMTSSANAGHCAEMQDGAHSMDPVKGQQAPGSADPGNGCDQFCGGGCCDGACSSCVHGLLALSADTAAIQDVHSKLSGIKVSNAFSGQTLSPPFRPPIPLYS